MSKLRFCGTCGLDFQQIPRKFARKYRRDPAHCPRCNASTDAEAYTLRHQDTAAQLAAGPLIVSAVAAPTSKTTPQRHLVSFISTLATSLVAVVLVLATLTLLDIIRLPGGLPVAMLTPTATNTLIATPTSVATATKVLVGPSTIMTIQPYALTADCGSITAVATTTLDNAGTTAFRWSATIAPQVGGVTPFQLTPLAGLLQPQTTQTLTISQIVDAGNIVITANGVAESIFVTCTTVVATPIGTSPVQ